MANWVDENRAGRGLIGTPVQDDKYNGDFSTANGTRYLTNLLNKNKQFDKAKQTGGAGATEGMLSEGNNITLMNPGYYNIAADKRFKFGTGASSTELIVHEAGHNSAKNATHTEDGSGSYEYTQTGLQSNQRGSIYVTPENRQNIINDEKNRSTIKNVDLTK